jgi:hypothetical protein
MWSCSPRRRESNAWGAEIAPNPIRATADELPVFVPAVDDQPRFPDSSIGIGERQVRDLRTPAWCLVEIHGILLAPAS